MTLALPRISRRMTGMILTIALLSAHGYPSRVDAFHAFGRPQHSSDSPSLVTMQGALTTVFSDDFSTDPNTNGNWSVINRFAGDTANEVSWDSGSNTTFLTRASDGKAGVMIANYALTATRWRASFRYRAGGGIDPLFLGEGFVFHFYKNGAAYATVRPMAAGALGFEGVPPSGACNSGVDCVVVPGYGIEFDTFGLGDTGPNRVGLIQNRVSNHIATVGPDARVSDNLWHDVVIDYDGGTIDVFIDSNVVLSRVILSVDMTFSGVGFSAATGLADENHEIDDFVLQTGGSTTPLIQSDANWKVLRAAPVGWQNAGFDDSGWGTSVAPSTGTGSCSLNPRIAVPMWAPGAVAGETVFFRKTLTLAQVPASVPLLSVFDDDGSLWVNGTLVRDDLTDGHNGVEPQPFLDNIAPHLVVGANVIAVQARDSLGGCQSVQLRSVSPLVSEPPATPPASPAAYVKQGLQPYSDGNPVWEADEYDSAIAHPLYCETSADSTMAECGCAVTSVAMIASALGVTRSPSGEFTTPQEVNNYFRLTDGIANSSTPCGVLSIGYDCGSVRWDALRTYSVQARDLAGQSGQPIVDLVAVKSILDRDYNVVGDMSNLKSLLRQSIDRGERAVVKVRNPAGHWVYVVDYHDDDFDIADPNPYTPEGVLSLQEHYNGNVYAFRAYGILDDMTANQLSSLDSSSSTTQMLSLSRINIFSSGSTYIAVTDPSGRTTGHNFLTGGDLTEIPGSFYDFTQPISHPGNVRPAAPEGTGRYNISMEPMDGVYTLTIMPRPPGVVESVEILAETPDLAFSHVTISPAGHEGEIPRIVQFRFHPEMGANALEVIAAGPLDAVGGIAVGEVSLRPSPRQEVADGDAQLPRPGSSTSVTDITRRPVHDSWSILLIFITAAMLLCVAAMEVYRRSTTTNDTTTSPE